MATNYLYGTVLTGEAVAANNRGENIGNTTTLQKVFVKDDLHTSVSAEAIRFALRYRFQLEGLPVNRSYDGVTGKLEYEDEKRSNWNPDADVYIDDDLMGFMDAAAAAKEREDDDETGDDGTSGSAPARDVAARVVSKKGRKPKGKTTKRPSPLAIGRAVSLRRYRGELSYNAVSGEKEKGKLSLYSAEMHTTEYQYSFGLNLNDVIKKENVGHLVAAIADPPPVAGNHARFAYDFSPASIVLRVTSAHSSRIQNCFEHDEGTRSYTAQRLIERIQTGDVPAREIVAGGAIAKTAEGAQLRELGVTVLAGVDAAAQEVRTRIARIDPTFAPVGQRAAQT